MKRIMLLLLLFPVGVWAIEQQERYGSFSLNFFGTFHGAIPFRLEIRISPKYSFVYSTAFRFGTSASSIASNIQHIETAYGSIRFYPFSSNLDGLHLTIGYGFGTIQQGALSSPIWLAQITSGWKITFFEWAMIEPLGEYTLLLGDPSQAPLSGQLSFGLATGITF